jgi:hypothetical protein
MPLHNAPSNNGRIKTLTWLQKNFNQGPQMTLTLEGGDVHMCNRGDIVKVYVPSTEG